MKKNTPMRIMTVSLLASVLCQGCGGETVTEGSAGPAISANIDVVQLLEPVVAEKSTGVFVFESGSSATLKKVYVLDGKLAFASSGAPQDRLGESMARNGLVTREQLDTAKPRVSESVSLGRALVELGYISPRQLLTAAHQQALDIVRSLHRWQGTVQKLPEPLPAQIREINYDLDLEPLLSELANESGDSN